ncbi:MAG: BLUF domain-containing protein [Pseudomonadota bacterium]
MFFGESRLVRLVYVSAATSRLSRRELIEIGEISRRNNREQRLTGLLLHVEGEFFQVLEGPERAVEEVFSRICEDPRNQWVTPLLREKLLFRVFRTWSMGCFDLPFETLPTEVFFQADWEQVRLRVNADTRQSFYRFLERFYAVNQEAGEADAFPA